MSCVNVVGVSSIPPTTVLYSGRIKKGQTVAVLTIPTNKTRFGIPSGMFVNSESKTKYCYFK